MIASEFEYDCLKLKGNTTDPVRIVVKRKVGVVVLAGQSGKIAINFENVEEFCKELMAAKEVYFDL